MQIIDGVTNLTLFTQVDNIITTIIIIYQIRCRYCNVIINLKQVILKKLKKRSLNVTPLEISQRMIRVFLLFLNVKIG